MLTEKKEDVVKTTQTITQINTIQWHNSYKTTNKSQVLHISQYRTTDMISQLVRTQGVWLGAELVRISYSHLMGIIHILFQHNSQCFEEPIIPKIMLA